MALSAFIAAILAGARWPLLQAAATLASCLLVLFAIAGVEKFASIDEDASISQRIRKRIETEELHR